MQSLPIGRLLSAYGSFLESAKDFSAACNEMSLAVTYQFAEDLRKMLSLVQLSDNTILTRNDLTQIVSILSHIVGCLRKESSLKIAMILPPEKVDFFEPNEPLFGKSVDEKFPSITYEIDEAGKCFALNRYTACVFHCMRAMEKGLDAVYASLALTKGKNPNWGGLLKEIKGEIDTRKTTSAWKISDDANFFPEAYISIDAVRNVWRNATMHIENKYTEEEAANIFNAVKGFMQKLSSRMDEQGQPLA